MKLRKKKVAKIVSINSKLLKYRIFVFNDIFQVQEPVLNHKMVEALIIHAQQIAKKALEIRGSGLNLVEDVKVCNYFLSHYIYLKETNKII